MKTQIATLTLALSLTLGLVGCKDDERHAASTSSAALPVAAMPDTPSLPASTLAPMELAAPRGGDEAAGREAERVAPRPEPAAELRPIRDLALRRLALTRGIEGREPVRPSTRFDLTSEPLYAFVEASNAGEDEEPLVITFEGPDGRRTGAVELTIPANAPRWRTWAFTRYASAPGMWSVEVRTLDGELIGRRQFVIE
ncbi:MAG: DUF2914 domain-containing protein [Myxococcales bacterium]|nr:DUF2914 domain-containing protein [Myxococcales bacterium]